VLATASLRPDRTPDSTRRRLIKGTRSTQTPTQTRTQTLTQTLTQTRTQTRPPPPILTAHAPANRHGALTVRHVRPATPTHIDARTHGNQGRAYTPWRHSPVASPSHARLGCVVGVLAYLSPAISCRVASHRIRVVSSAHHQHDVCCGPTSKQTTHLLARSLGLVAPQSRFACLALAVSRRPRDAHHGHLPSRVHTSIDIIDAHRCASLRHARGRCDAGCCVRGACQRPPEMMSCWRVCWVRVLRCSRCGAASCAAGREGQGCRDVLWRKLGFASGADE
jgi:hypothetical protein